MEDSVRGTSTAPPPTFRVDARRQAPLRIRELVAIYRYDGGLRGGIDFLASRVHRDGDCALRALTHRGFRANREWSTMAANLAVPIVLGRLDRSPTPIRRAAGHVRPCVVANSRAGAVLLLGPKELERIGGRVDRFVDELRAAAAGAGLSWTLAMYDNSLVTA